jgi:hypothetical protein
MKSHEQIEESLHDLQRQIEMILVQLQLKPLTLPALERHLFRTSKLEVTR